MSTRRVIPLQYVAVQSPGDSYWHVVDENGFLCHVCGNRHHAVGVAQFLSDSVTPSREGVTRWIEKHHPGRVRRAGRVGSEWPNG